MAMIRSKQTAIYFGLLGLLLEACQPQPEPDLTEEIKLQKGEALWWIESMVSKVGSMQALRELSDVTYRYTFHDLVKDRKDISLERYLFEGERSWASYETHDHLVMPEANGKVIQAFDGEATWVTLNDSIIESETMIQSANFLRRANFYWFCMMQKMLDEGLNYQLLEDPLVEDQLYKIVKVSFDADVGDVQDDFVLYINPSTYLVDQFLFTVKGIGISNPLLMEVEYEQVDEMYLMARRWVIPSDWQGNRMGSPIIAQWYEDIRFGSGLNESFFRIQERY